MIQVTPIKSTVPSPGVTRVAASIRYSLLRREVLWFDVPKFDADNPSPGDGWLILALPMAFELGEPLRIEAPVNPQLLENAEHLQRLWSSWFPPRKPVPVHAPVAKPDRTAPDRTGLFFTAGADSFFSLLHFGTSDPGEPSGRVHPIDDLIFVCGFDIPLTARAALERKAETISKVAASFGKSPVIAATNLRQTRLGKPDWGKRLHGAAMAAAAFLAGRRYKTAIISASLSDKDPTPWGSNSAAVPLLSSSDTRFVCYGGQFNRFEKFCCIAGSDVALENLHVCWEAESEKNCGHCEKCIRALVTLELLNKRSQATSFPQTDFSLEALRTLKLKHRLIVGLWMELREAALRFSRADVLGAIDACFAANSIRA